MAIKFFLNEIYIKVPERIKLKKNISALFVKEERSLASLTYIFCSDRYLLALNKEFLGHNDYTDVITFTLSEQNKPIIGEIYISADRIKYNAKALGLPISQELHRLIFHGALHLCGYKDKNPTDKIKMTAAEDKYLTIYFG